MTEKIHNQEYYLAEMRKSLLDKIFFIDKMFEPVKNIVDFGCADGSLLALLQELFPQYTYFGYDNCHEMIQTAEEKNQGIMFSDDFNTLVANINPKESVLNLSSVIHEVYSYCTKEQIAEFWNRVFKTGFKYICFRDMMLSESESSRYTFSMCDFIKFPAGKVNDFIMNWGNVETNVSAIHLFLKSQFFKSENWGREVKENYLPIFVEDLLKIIPKNYEITYCRHYVFPYFKEYCKKNAGIDLTIPTHLQLILKKK